MLLQSNKKNILTCMFLCCSYIIMIYSPAFWQKSVSAEDSQVSLTAGGNKSPGEVLICPEKKIKHTHIAPFIILIFSLTIFIHFFLNLSIIFDLWIPITHYKPPEGSWLDVVKAKSSMHFFWAIMSFLKGRTEDFSSDLCR